MIWIIDFDVVAEVLIVVVLAIYFLQDQFPNRSNKLFLVCALVTLVSAFSDIITAYTNSGVLLVPIWMNYILNMVYYLSFNSIPIVVYMYAANRTTDNTIRTWSKAVIATAFSIEWLLILTTPVTHLLFYFEQGVYTHGILRNLMYILAAAMIGLTIFQIITHRGRLRKVQFLSELFFMVIVIGLLVFQHLNPEVLLLNFVVALFLIASYMNLQDSGVYQNKTTECFNKKAFHEQMNMKLRKKEDCAILALKFDGHAYINRMVGVEASKAMMKEIGVMLCAEFNKINVYNVSDGEFYIVLSSTKEAQERVSFIEQKFANKTSVDDVWVDWEPLICLIELPTIVDTVDDIEVVADYGYEQFKFQSDLHLVVADHTFLDAKRRKREVEQAINCAITNRTLEVAFQPIYNRHTGKFSSAEALVRLTDDHLGRISPAEFVPIAEETGSIGQIDSFVFEQVCEFMEKSEILEYGVEYIEVNLSAIEFMEARLWNRLSEVMIAHHILPREINFEITETAYMEMESQFESNIKQLLFNGASISMDDYGTGFSNISYLLKYPYKLVKIDQTMLWRAMKEQRAMTVLEDAVTILKEIGCDIVVEGVETKEQVALMERLQIDELQGYYYSRPLGMVEFEAFLQKNNKGGQQVEL